MWKNKAYKVFLFSKKMSNNLNIKTALYETLGPKISPKPAPFFNLKEQPLKTISFDWDCGGWNNIRMGVEIMTCLAKIFNRALVFPKPSKWYLLDGDTHLFDFYDERSFTSFVPTSSKPKKGKVWNVSKEFGVDKDGKLDISRLKEYQDYDHWFFPKETRMFAYFPLVFSNLGALYPLIQSALRIKSSLIEKACQQLKENNLELGKYIALHVRRNDFQYSEIRERKCEDIVSYVLKNIKEKLPVLIISDVYDVELINLFEKEGHRVVCWSQKKEASKMERGISNKDCFHMGTNSKESIVIDMLCASLAFKFYGSSLSTLSSGIMHWRGLLNKLYPQINANILYTMPVCEKQPWWSSVTEEYWGGRKQIREGVLRKIHRLLFLK